MCNLICRIEVDFTRSQRSILWRTVDSHNGPVRCGQINVTKRIGSVQVSDLGLAQNYVSLPVFYDRVGLLQPVRSIESKS